MPSTPFKGFALIDCNNFYVSCERVFKPHLNNKPVVVLSNNDGCIIARSNEVKAMGVSMGAPLFKYRELFLRKKVTIFSPNFALYADLSDRVMKMLCDFSSKTEIYSIDEAFIYLEGQTDEDFLALKEKVMKWCGIPISIGIARTKTLAKIANQRAKKKSLGVLKLFGKKLIEEVLSQTPVEDVWGIGKRQSEKLFAKGIFNALSFQQAPLDWIRKKFHLPGMRTALELKGTPCFLGNEHSQKETQKSFCFSRSFGAPITSFLPLKESVVHYTTRVAQKLREKGLLAQILGLYLKTDQGSFQSSLALKTQTNTTPTLIEAALTLLNKMYFESKYLKVGVHLWDLTLEKKQQLHFLSQENEAHLRLMPTLDAINAKYGQETLFYAGQGTKAPWSSKRDLLSPGYTTLFDEILKIKI